MTFRREFREGATDVSWSAWHIIWKIAPFFFFFAVVGVGIGIFNKGCQVVDTVTNPDRMIYTYEHFHDLYAKNEAAKEMIAIKEAQLNVTVSMGAETLEERRELRMIQTELTGLQENRLNIVAEYNAHSAKMTRNFLRDSDLPERLH